MTELKKQSNCQNGIGFVNQPCFIPAQEVLHLVGKKWGIQLIHLLRDGNPKRYNEIKEELRKGWKEKQISDATLSDRLADFVKKGIINREVYPEIPPKVEYHLSDKGMSLSQALQPLVTWAHDFCHGNL
ncbi:MAG: helix-turn-helix transcriptional regulator [Asgard group archaeon]|nr:helix-turn-helix transcriptional regulator [Asgard group archaeon]